MSLGILTDMITSTLCQKCWTVHKIASSSSYANGPIISTYRPKLMDSSIGLVAYT